MSLLRSEGEGAGNGEWGIGNGEEKALSFGDAEAFGRVVEDAGGVEVVEACRPSPPPPKGGTSPRGGARAEEQAARRAGAGPSRVGRCGAGVSCGEDMWQTYTRGGGMQDGTRASPELGAQNGPMRAESWWSGGFVRARLGRRVRNVGRRALMARRNRDISGTGVGHRCHPAIKVRAKRSTGELEVEGPAAVVAEWWEKLWPELVGTPRVAAGPYSQRQALLPASNVDLPDVFGEFYTEFRSDVTDVDKVLIAGAFIHCFEAKQYRAAVVFSWAGAVALLHKKVFTTKLAEFNAEATRRDAKWRTAKQQDDLGRMKEHDFLDVCEAIGILGKSVKQVLQSQCLVERNGCGHPNTLVIAENSVANHIEKLIKNVFSKF